MMHPWNLAVLNKIKLRDARRAAQRRREQRWEAENREYRNARRRARPAQVTV